MKFGRQFDYSAQDLRLHKNQEKAEVHGIYLDWINFKNSSKTFEQGFFFCLMKFSTITSHLTYCPAVISFKLRSHCYRDVVHRQVNTCVRKCNPFLARYAVCWLPLSDKTVGYRHFSRNMSH